MRNFICKVAMLGAPVLVMLVSVNYFGDAAKLFDSNYERKLAEIIISGQFATNIHNYDERLFQKELISNGNIHPHTIILGSSRTMLISSDLLPDDVSVFNNSVSGASLEDIISIYQLYKDNKKIPRKIIIGIDPWTFNENNNQNRWQSIAVYYHRFHSSKTHEVDPQSDYGTLSKYRELFSMSYFQASIKSFSQPTIESSQPQPTIEKYNISNTILTDGSLVYNLDFRNASKGEVENSVNSYLAGNIYSIEGFSDISERIWNEFNDLITDMKINDVEIEFFLSPYHPKVYEKVKDFYPMVLETEEIILEFARSNNIRLYGSFDPSELDMDENYFYDGMHCKKNGVENILRMNR